MSTPGDLPYWIAFSRVEYHWVKSYKLLRSGFPTMAEAWFASVGELRQSELPPKAISAFLEARRTIDPNKVFEEVERLGLHAITIDDDRYPTLLREISDPPALLFIRGTVPPPTGLRLAVVGTRRPTRYGEHMTAELTEAVAAAGVTIVSGLAIGLDAIAHRTCLEVGGRTVAVLGCSLDRVYPVVHERLAEEIVERKGCLVSEFPPGIPALPHRFPARNRIVAGMCQGTLVTEGDVTSGALITARFALESGREVFAVPGNVTSIPSRGPNDLIKQGATPVTEVTDLFRGLGLDPPEAQPPTAIAASVEERKILSAISRGPLPVDEIIRRSTLPPSVVARCLSQLELRNVVKNLGGQHFAVRNPRQP